MRVISQNGLVSLNFDHTDIFLNQETICTNRNNKTLILAKYESCNRALEVFEELHFRYKTNSKIYEFPQE